MIVRGQATDSSKENILAKFYFILDPVFVCRSVIGPTLGQGSALQQAWELCSGLTFKKKINSSRKGKQKPLSITSQ